MPIPQPTWQMTRSLTETSDAATDEKRQVEQGPQRQSAVLATAVDTFADVGTLLVHRNHSNGEGTSLLIPLCLVCFIAHRALTI